MPYGPHGSAGWGGGNLRSHRVASRKEGVLHCWPQPSPSAARLTAGTVGSRKGEMHIRRQFCPPPATQPREERRQRWKVPPPGFSGGGSPLATGPRRELSQSSSRPDPKGGGRGGESWVNSASREGLLQPPPSTRDQAPCCGGSLPAPQRYPLPLSGARKMRKQQPSPGPAG